MWSIYLHTIKKSYIAVSSWGTSLALLAIYLLILYEPVVKTQGQLDQLLKAYPPELMTFFGDYTQYATPGGYLDFGFFSYVPIVLGILALIDGSGLIASDEENGSLDLILSHPVSRTSLFWGKFLAFSTNMSLILLITWLGIILGESWSTVKLDNIKLILPFLSLLAELILFAAIGLFLSMLLPSRRVAASVTAVILVASYFISSMVRINKDLEGVAIFSPLNYYQSTKAMDGLNQAWFWGLIIVSLVLICLAWWLFENRDIRVSGESGWRLPVFNRK